MSNNTLTPYEASICLLAIERENTMSSLIMKGDPWCTASPDIMRSLMVKLESIRRGDKRGV
jgi:hypothetical protein